MCFFIICFSIWQGKTPLILSSSSDVYWWWTTTFVQTILCFPYKLMKKIVKFPEEVY